MLFPKFSCLSHSFHVSPKVFLLATKFSCQTPSFKLLPLFQVSHTVSSQSRSFQQVPEFQVSPKLSSWSQCLKIFPQILSQFITSCRLLALFILNIHTNRSFYGGLNRQHTGQTVLTKFLPQLRSWTQVSTPSRNLIDNSSLKSRKILSHQLNIEV